MKDFTKLICDLISYGTQLTSPVPMEQKMEFLKRSTIGDTLAPFGTVDFDKVQQHIEDTMLAIRGADFDIDIRPRLAQDEPAHISNIIEFHGKYTVKLSDGRSLTYNDGVTHY